MSKGRFCVRNTRIVTILLCVTVCGHVPKAGPHELLQKSSFLLNHITTSEMKLNCLSLAAALCTWMEGCENTCCLKGKVPQWLTFAPGESFLFLPGEEKSMSVSQTSQSLLLISREE